MGYLYALGSDDGWLEGYWVDSAGFVTYDGAGAVPAAGFVGVAGAAGAAGAGFGAEGRV